MTTGKLCQRLATYLSVLSLLGCAGAPDFEPAEEGPPMPPPRYGLGELPSMKTFNELAFNGSPVGFTYLEVEPAAAQRFRVRSQAYMNLNLLGVKRISVVNALSIVDAGLRLAAFDYRYWVDGVDSHLVGTVDGLSLSADITRNGRHHHNQVELKYRVLPSAALPLYPVLHGLEVGRQYRFAYLDGEKLRVKLVEQTVEAYESSEEVGRHAFRIVSNVQGQKVETWMSARAEPLFEASMGGVFTARTLPPGEALLPVIDAVLDGVPRYVPLGRVAADTPIEAPGEVIGLKVRLTGLGENDDLPSSLFQYCEQSSTGPVCEISTPSLDTRLIGTAFDESGASLSATPAIAVDHPAVGEIASSLETSAATPVERIAAALQWIRDNIGEAESVPSEVPAVLESGRAGTRGRVYLYTALARRLGIPTRVRCGIRYTTAANAFGYRCWAESWLDGLWHRVDPLEQQLPADATHIALSEGDETDAVTSLFPFMGRLSVQVLEVYR